jgi:DNA-binding transcriptional MerR regulator
MSEVKGFHPPIGISAVERDTGLSKDTLRIWERRYGFPHPARDAHGERIYPFDQVAKLRLIRRLMDRGHRPGKIIRLSPAELEQLSTQTSPLTALAPEQRAFIDLIRAHDVDRLRLTLTQELMRQGIERFVLETVPLLNEAIGDSWMRGEIEIHEEHLYSQQIENILHNAIAALPMRGTHPRVVLTSLPGEQHNIGLMMVHALLALRGAACIPLGTEMPIPEIVRAAAAHEAEVIALSFSASFASSIAADCLRELRTALPSTVALWAGGAGVSRMRRAVPGVEVVRTLGDLAALVRNSGIATLQAA